MKFVRQSLILLGLALLLPLTLAAVEPVGRVVALDGAAEALGVDKTTRVLAVKSPIFMNDKITTAKKSKLQVMFNDETMVSQGERSEIIINEYVYTPGDKEKSKSSMNAIKGVFRVVTGKITKLNPERFKVKTRMATIGIRGCELGFRISDAAEDVYIIDLAGGKESVIIEAAGLGMAAGAVDPLKNSILTREAGKVVSVAKGRGLSQLKMAQADLALLLQDCTPAGVDPDLDLSSLPADGDPEPGGDGPPALPPPDDTAMLPLPPDDPDNPPPDGAPMLAPDGTPLPPPDAEPPLTPDGTPLPLPDGDPLPPPPDGDVAPMMVDMTGDPLLPPIDDGLAPLPPPDGDVAPMMVDMTGDPLLPPIDDGLAPLPPPDGDVAPIVDMTGEPLFPALDDGMPPLPDEMDPIIMDPMLDVAMGDNMMLDPNAPPPMDSGDAVQDAVTDNPDENLLLDQVVDDMGMDQMVDVLTDPDGMPPPPPDGEPPPDDWAILLGDPPPPDDGGGDPTDPDNPPPPPPPSDHFVYMGGSGNWEWGIWENDAGVPQGVDFRPLIPNVTPGDYQAILAGATEYNLSGVGTCAALLKGSGLRRMVQGSVNLNVQIGNGLSNWDGTFSMNNGVGDFLNFTILSGGFDAAGRLQGNLTAYSMQLDGMLDPSPIGYMIDGRLHGSGQGPDPVEAVTGYFFFDNPSGHTAAGGFGSDLN